MPYPGQAPQYPPMPDYQNQQQMPGYPPMQQQMPGYPPMQQQMPGYPPMQQSMPGYQMQQPMSGYQTQAPIPGQYGDFQQQQQHIPQQYAPQYSHGAPSMVTPQVITCIIIVAPISC